MLMYLYDCNLALQLLTWHRMIENCYFEALASLGGVGVRNEGENGEYGKGGTSEKPGYNLERAVYMNIYDVNCWIKIVW